MAKHAPPVTPPKPHKWMFTAEQYRRKAARMRELQQDEDDPRELAELKELEQAYLDLAAAQERLAKKT